MNTETSTDANLKQIPREFQISNPLPPFTPNKVIPLESFNESIFKPYLNFLQVIIPNYDLDPAVLESDAIKAIKAEFELEKPQKLFSTQMLKIFLVNCHSLQVHLMSHPSFTKFSMLHHELYLASVIIKTSQSGAIELRNYCDMMMADTMDLYHSHFSDILEHQFWGRTKTVDDVIKNLLTKEFERLRLLNDYTYKTFASLAMKKAIDSAPNSMISKLVQWAKTSNIPFE